MSVPRAHTRALTSESPISSPRYARHSRLSASFSPRSSSKTCAPKGRRRSLGGGYQKKDGKVDKELTPRRIHRELDQHLEEQRIALELREHELSMLRKKVIELEQRKQLEKADSELAALQKKMSLLSHVASEIQRLETPRSAAATPRQIVTPRLQGTPRRSKDETMGTPRLASSQQGTPRRRSPERAVLESSESSAESPQSNVASEQKSQRPVMPSLRLGAADSRPLMPSLRLGAADSQPQVGKSAVGKSGTPPGPVVPGLQLGAKPVVPGLQLGAKPVVPGLQLGAKPVVPGLQLGAKPVVPGLQLSSALQQSPLFGDSNGSIQFQQNDDGHQVFAMDSDSDESDYEDELEEASPPSWAMVTPRTFCDPPSLLNRHRSEPALMAMIKEKEEAEEAAAAAGVSPVASDASTTDTTPQGAQTLGNIWGNVLKKVTSLRSLGRSSQPQLPSVSASFSFGFNSLEEQLPASATSSSFAASFPAPLPERDARPLNTQTSPAPLLTLEEFIAATPRGVRRHVSRNGGW